MTIESHRLGAILHPLLGGTSWKLVLQPHSKLLTDLDKAGIEIAFTQSIADETDPELQKVKVRFDILLNGGCCDCDRNFIFVQSLIGT